MFVYSILLFIVAVGAFTSDLDPDNQLCKSRLYNTVTKSGVWVTPLLSTSVCALSSSDGDHSAIWFGSSDGLDPDLRWNYGAFTLSLELQLHDESGNAGLLLSAQSIIATESYGGEYYYIALHPGDNLVVISVVNGTNHHIAYGGSYIYGIGINTPYTITVSKYKLKKKKEPLYDISINDHSLFTGITLDAYPGGGTIGLKSNDVSSTFLSLTFEPHTCDNADDTECDVTCGNSEFLSAGYAIGDDGDLFDDVKDICESEEFKILVSALSVIPAIGSATQSASKAVCKAVSFIGVLCDVFNIDECRSAKKSSSVVASCWSSNTFSTTAGDLDYAFQSYLDDTYGISASLGDTKAVEDEVYKLTQVEFDNCGRSGNHFIAGIYDLADNAEQNDIVSDVVEFLVNKGIASADNPVGGVSSVDRSEADGVPLTDVIRSNSGVLFHYAKTDGLSYNDDIGIFYCEFNVVGGNWDAAPKRNAFNPFIHIIVFIFVFVA